MRTPKKVGKAKAKAPKGGGKAKARAGPATLSRLPGLVHSAPLTLQVVCQRAQVPKGDSMETEGPSSSRPQVNPARLPPKHWLPGRHRAQPQPS